MGSEWDIEIWTKDHGFPVDDYRWITVNSGEGLVRLFVAFVRTRRYKRPVRVIYRGFATQS